jgi:MFS family permease
MLLASSSLLDGLAWSEGSLIAFRALQGLGAARISPAALSILNQYEPADRRSDRHRRGHDRHDVRGPLRQRAPRFDPLSGGALTHGFQIAFYVLAAVAAAGGLLALLMIESQPPLAQEASLEDEGEVELKAA